MPCYCPNSTCQHATSPFPNGTIQRCTACQTIRPAGGWPKTATANPSQSNPAAAAPGAGAAGAAVLANQAAAAAAAAQANLAAATQAAQSATLAAHGESMLAGFEQWIEAQTGASVADMCGGTEEQLRTLAEAYTAWCGTQIAAWKLDDAQAALFSMRLVTHLKRTNLANEEV